MSGDITDVPGVRVGHWSDHEARTGCTVVLLPDEGAVTSVEVRGAAPGTRETDLLAPGASVPVAHALVLTGGSAFGLAAADGVMRWLEGRGAGWLTPAGRVPIVPGAVLYDLAVGRADVRPDAASGQAAAEHALVAERCGRGRVGAGTGATVGKLFGPDLLQDGGLGTAALPLPLPLPRGGVVGALAAVNAVGDVVGADGKVLAGPGTVDRLLRGEDPVRRPLPGTSTTLALVATDVRLTPTQAHRLAVVAHDGLARAIAPVHTAFDGDTVFVTSTAGGDAPELDAAQLLALEVAATEVLATAVRSAVA
jgi:L-aminopeptidase/D-esterase-like protein